MHVRFGDACPSTQPEDDFTMPEKARLYDYFISAEEDVEMSAGHEPLWQTMIDHMLEDSLADKTVLDFGCNIGGLLRLLYDRKPYKLGVGVDVAEQTIKMARARKGSYPITFEATGTLENYANQIDVALNHEVLYLLPNLFNHATDMYRALKPGGVYYVSTGANADHPLWSRWRDLFQRETQQNAYDYTLNDYANAFAWAGFELSAQKFRYSGFVKLRNDRRLFPTVMDALNYYNDYKVLWRLTKPA